MAFCPKCGANFPDDDNFCPNCGNPAAAAYSDPAEKTNLFSQEDRERNRYLAALCYFGPMFMLIALLAERESGFVRFHANQGLLLMLLYVASALVLIVPFIGWVAGGVGCIISLVFGIMGIVRACKARAVDMPIIGKYVILHY